MNNIAGAILAGGKSSRMGKDKAELIINNQSMLETMQQILRECEIENIYISRTNQIEDIIKNLGPLSGIHAILHQLIKKYEQIIFVPIDMPALKSELIKSLIMAPQNYDLVYFAGQRLPLRLACKEEILSQIERQLKIGKNHSLGFFIDNIEQKLSLPLKERDKKSFFNINNPDEYKKYCSELKR